MTRREKWREGNVCEMKVNSFPMDSLCSSPSLSSLYPIISQRRLLEERKRDKGIRPCLLIFFRLMRKEEDKEWRANG